MPFCPSFAGMLPVLLLAGSILALSISGTASESATLRFLGQTDFVVKESSTTVVRLVVERVGDPVNVTALVLVRKGDAILLMINISVLNDAPKLYLATLLCHYTLDLVHKLPETPKPLELMAACP